MQYEYVFYYFLKKHSDFLCFFSLNGLTFVIRGNDLYYPRETMLDRIKRRFQDSPITFSLITLMIAITILRYVILLLVRIDINYFLSLVPSSVLRGERLWTLITSFFIHDDFLRNPFHLIANMIALYYIGRYVEQLLGEKYYLMAFLLTGIGGSLCIVFMAYTLKVLGYSPFYNSPHLGASGAILGLFAILAQHRPRLQILFFLFIPPYLILPILAQAKWVLIIQLLLDLILGFVNLPFDFIAHFGHVGGMVTGILLYKWFLWRRIYTISYGVVFIER